MGRMNEDVVSVLAKTKVVPVATASKDGVPNVVPMTFVKQLDDTAILIADNFMDKGAKNLEENPNISICVWDLETKHAYQIKGKADVQRAGQVYDDTVAWVHETKPDAKPKAAVVLRVTNVYICHSGPDRGKDVVLP